MLSSGAGSEETPQVVKLLPRADNLRFPAVNNGAESLTRNKWLPGETRMPPARFSRLAVSMSEIVEEGEPKDKSFADPL
jgi:hypothetical protein